MIRAVLLRALPFVTLSATALAQASDGDEPRAPAPTEPPPAPDPAPAPEPAPAPDPAPPPAPPSAAEPVAAGVVPVPADDARPPAFTPWPKARLLVDLAVYAQARWANRPGEDLTEIRLDRGELGARLALGGHAATELRLESVRSAIEGGALGIDGDSTVFRVRVAQVMAGTELGPARLEGALGIVPDPWIRRVEDGYTLRPVSRTGSERLLGWAPADLSMWVRGTIGPARLTVSAGNGEGLRFPERNTGKTTTGVLEVVAVNTRDVRLVLAGVGRDGSIGVASIRERRAGGNATVVTPWVRAGVEVVQAWGLGERGEAEGLATSGWAEGRLASRVFASLRGASLGIDGGGRQSTFGGALAVAPWRTTLTTARGAPGNVRVWLAVDRMTSSGGAMPVVGADAGDATIVMLIASADAPVVFD